MKRKIMGMMAVVLGLSLSAFMARPADAKLPSYYWFPLNSAAQPQPVSQLTYQFGDPYGCAHWAWGGYCAGGFSSYSGAYPYYRAAGIEVLLDFHIIPLGDDGATQR